MNATLQGLSTLRACNASKILEKEFHEFQDHNTSCYFMFNSASRWFALWLDITSFLFSAFVVYSFLILQNSKFRFRLTNTFLDTLFSSIRKIFQL